MQFTNTDRIHFMSLQVLSLYSYKHDVSKYIVTRKSDQLLHVIQIYFFGVT